MKRGSTPSFYDEGLSLRGDEAGFHQRFLRMYKHVRGPVKAFRFRGKLAILYNAWRYAHCFTSPSVISQMNEYARAAGVEPGDMFAHYAEAFSYFAKWLSEGTVTREMCAGAQVILDEVLHRFALMKLAASAKVGTGELIKFFGDPTYSNDFFPGFLRGEARVGIELQEPWREEFWLGVAEQVSVEEQKRGILDDQQRTEVAHAPSRITKGRARTLPPLLHRLQTAAGQRAAKVDGASGYVVRVSRAGQRESLLRATFTTICRALRARGRDIERKIRKGIPPYHRHPWRTLRAKLNHPDWSYPRIAKSIRVAERTIYRHFQRCHDLLKQKKIILVSSPGESTRAKSKT